MEKYVTGAQCFVYVNGSWAKSVESIEFSENLNRRPLYGVLSQEIKNMTEGSLEIQGNIMVYHDQTGEFETLIEENQRAANRNLSPREVLQEQLQTLARNGDTAKIIDLFDKASTNEIGSIIETMNEAVFAAASLSPENFPKILGRSFANGVLSPKNMASPISRIRIVYPDHHEEFQDVWITGRTKAIRNGARVGAQAIVQSYGFVARKLIRE